MPGSSSFDPYAVPLTIQATTIVTAIWNGTEYQQLPNIRCLQIQEHEGASPPAARFEYIFDTSDPDSPYPVGLEATWPLTQATLSPYVVAQDDRLVVFGYSASGTRRVLFDGYANIPQANLSPNHQSVTFSATGVAIRMWDVPIHGAVYRQSDDPQSVDPDKLVPTDLPVRFNPHVQGKSQPNATDYDYDTEDDDITYPAFLDWKLKDDPAPQDFWTLAGAVRHLLAQYNTATWSFNGELFVANPDFGQTEAVLKNYKPDPENGFINPEDPATYTADEITIRDYDATNKPLPVVLEELLGYHGFGFRFVLEDDGAGDPSNAIEIYRKDGQFNAKRWLYLQDHGDDLDPGQSNCSHIQLARDAHQPANQFRIEAAPVEYEVSVILAPLFEIAVGDAALATGATNPYLKSNLTNATATERKKYRWFGVDEIGAGFWDFDTAAFITSSPFDFREVFGNDVEGVPTFVNRLRPGKGTLLSKDNKGLPRNRQLSISRDWDGGAPAFWDGTGTWQDIGDGNWALLKDQLGIELTCPDPEGLKTVSHNKTVNPSEKVSVVTSLSNPGSEQVTKLFWFRLTTVIEADESLSAVAKKRAAATTMFVTERVIDAKDHFKKQIVDPSSEFATEFDQESIRDDTEKATDYAEALRAAHEFPALAGSVTIPFITLSYSPGDQIKGIRGRDVDFTINAGQGGGEAARYPTVVGRTFELGSGQQTVLHLTDRRAEPERAMRW